ncbi:MFS transporter, partial [Rheinheimera sp.]|uniref:MFS transporter n=1 Tax=Rheinheimera sp. TaxID=1869214 RepID=UPI00307DFBC0
MSESVIEKKYLGIRVNDGVTGWHMSTFYLTCVATILLGTFINAFQPFLFNEIMHIPTDAQGVVSGKLNFWGEMAIIGSVGVWGALSDKLGRRLIMVLGFLLVAVAMYLYPHAQSVNELIIYRVIYGLGIASATCMIVTLLADYAKDINRGKAAGLQGVCNGVGAVIALFVLLRLPAIFQQQGMSAVQAGTQTYLIVAGFSVAVGLLSVRGLKAHQPAEQTHKQSIWSLMVDGVKAAREPGIALAYGAAFVSRANLTIVGAFMTLWLSHYGTEQAGMSGAEALKKAGIIVAIAQSVALFGAPLFGILTDKLNRVTALLIALFITFVGYCSTYLISDPFGSG